MKLVVISVLFFVHITSSAILHGNLTEANTIVQGSQDGCECISYNCGCCQHLELPSTLINGSLCANATYLPQDYGISLTITYNDFALINETVSARNPPPICFGEDIVDMLQAEICIRLYDIQIGKENYHVCFSLLGKIGKIKLAEIKLGCANSHVMETMINTIKEDTEALLHKMEIKTIEEPPNVIMV